MKHKNNFKDWIVFEDDDYLVINKPAFISTLADRNDKVNVLELSRSYARDSPVCHRLDKETSGALLIAKNKEAYTLASKQFTDRKIEKTYHAIAGGMHDFNNQVIDKPIHVAPSGMVRVSFKRGKPSETIVSTLTKYRSYTLIECKPITGRMHQIRIHLASVSAPLVADLNYGGKHLFLSELKKKYRQKTELEERPLIPRVALHAFSLKFKNMKGQNQYVECPYPKDFRTVISQLSKNR